MDPIWNTIIEDALKQALETIEAAIPGAKFRELVVKIASANGLPYPPDGHQQEKFGDFLKRFDKYLIVQRRVGQDVLVAPVDKPQLFSQPGTGITQVRRDIFEAFTRIPHGFPLIEPRYVKVEDAVVWRPVDEDYDSNQLVRIPPSTLDQELDDRRKFSNSTEIAEEDRTRLLYALERDPPLGSFSVTLKSRGLAQKWHFYRLRSVIGRIRKWCEAEQIQWRGEWVTVEGTRADNTQPPASFHIAAARRNEIARLMDNLTDEDFRRITVPLDVVIRLLEK